jgi:hypothetical protein
MPVINKGTALSNGEQLTAEKLNDLLDLATFSPTATDSVSTFVNSSGQIAVLDGGIAANKLATNAVSTTKILDANVTFAKLTDVIDDDTMATATDTTLATSESIKAYVDSNGITQSTGTAPYYGCRAWAFYNQVTDTVEASGNIASIVRTSTGYSTVTFTEPMPSAFYAISITGSGTVNVQHTVGFINGTPTASGFGIAFFNTQNSANVANNNKIGITVFA